MFRHCPAMPSRSSASLIAVVSSFDARCTLMSSECSATLLPFEHCFVALAHHLRHGLSFVQRGDHRTLARCDCLGSVEDFFDLVCGHEHDARAVSNYKVSW